MTEPKKQEDLINELGVALREGLVVIEFKKKDGSTTRRTVTLNDKIIADSGYVFKEAVEGAPKRAVNPAQLNFYEVDSKAWKSCIKENIIGFERVKPLDQLEKENPAGFRNPE